MSDYVPRTEKDWQKMIDDNPYLTDAYKLFLKSKFATKGTDNEAKSDRLRDNL